MTCETVKHSSPFESKDVFTELFKCIQRKALTTFGLQSEALSSSPEMTCRCRVQAGQVRPQGWRQTWPGTGRLGSAGYRTRLAARELESGGAGGRQGGTQGWLPRGIS